MQTEGMEMVVMTQKVIQESERELLLLKLEASAIQSAMTSIKKREQNTISFGSQTFLIDCDIIEKAFEEQLERVLHNQAHYKARLRNPKIWVYLYYPEPSV
jgi:adenine-specific DNA glycosylase